MEIKRYIVARGDGWLGVAKPPGIAVIPGRDQQPALNAAVEKEFGARVWVVHRIDKETSGAVLFATTAEMHRTLSMAFEERKVKKRYLALTAGIPEPAIGDITVPLHTARKSKMRPAHPGEEGALASETHYEVIERYKDAALVRCEPHTGRQHQIRVHLRSLGTPLLSDPLYGKPHIAIARLALHAEHVGVNDISFTVPLWSDLVEATDRLSR